MLFIPSNTGNAIRRLISPWQYTEETEGHGFHTDVGAQRKAHDTGKHIMSNTLRRVQMGLFILAVLSIALVASAQAGKPPATTVPVVQSITLLPGDGMNLTITEQEPGRVAVKLTTTAANWFAGTFANLPTDRETTIELALAGSGSKENPASVVKWADLHPVMTYADPAKYATYEWFAKDTQGRWVSGDPLKTGEARYAGTGKVPVQQVIPVAVAEQFLSRDGKYWSAWREIETIDAVMDKNIFRIKQQFALPKVTVAMRIPYPPKYQQAFSERLEKAHLPGVTVHAVGKSTQGRPLTVIQVDDPDDANTAANHPVLLLYGAEDGNEPDGAWVVDGAIRWLISQDAEAQQLRKKVTVLAIPELDVDGAASATYACLTNTFMLTKPDQQPPAATLGNTAFMNTWFKSGRRLDLVCAFHNVECLEAPNVMCPIIDQRHVSVMQTLNQTVLEHLAGYATTPKTWMTGFFDTRFSGWCSRHVGSLATIYEINSRYPSQRLTQAHLQGAGMCFTQTFADFLYSPTFATLAPAIERRRKNQYAQQQQFWAKQKITRPPTPYETLVMGY